MSVEPVPEDEDGCPTCGDERCWVQCEECGGAGVRGHDCGEDTCCCRYPEENVKCPDCNGVGGWGRCLTCHPMRGE